MKTSCLRITAVSATLAMSALVAPAFAVELGDRIDLHGYGFQTYAQASANSYMGADTHGTWDNNFLGLVMAATLTDKSKVWAQLESSSGGGTNFTWFFGDYDLTDSVRLHAGRVKLPLGFYNEIIDAKSLQPAALEPALYQSAADMVHDAYQGAGVDYEQDLAGGHVRWQAWGGNVYDVAPPVDLRDRRAFGGRVTYQTPVSGLTVMVSGYRTQVQRLADGSMVNEDRGILSAGFANDAWDVKAEYAKHKFAGVDSHAWYVQGGYALTSKWKPYARYDYVNTDQSHPNDPAFQQKTWVAGVGYRLDDSIGLKLESHFNHGYALPVAEGSVAAGAGTRSWNLVVLAADFAF